MNASQRNTYRRSTLASQVQQLQAQLASQKGETRKALNARVKAQAKSIEAQAKTIEDQKALIASLETLNVSLREKLEVATASVAAAEAAQ
jgi:cell division protein FtsB